MVFDEARLNTVPTSDELEPKIDRPLWSAAPGQARLLPPFAPLRAFEAVGRLGGARRAAQELGIDQSSVTRHVRTLEDWAGVKLFEGASCALLTLEGQAFHRKVSQALGDISRASLELTRLTDDQLILWCSPGLAYRWLGGKIGEFIRAHPALDIEMRPTDRAPDFGRSEADVDLRYVIDGTAPPDKIVICREVLRPRLVAVACPAVASQLAGSLSAQALLTTPLLHETDDQEWRAWLQVHGVATAGPLKGERFWHAKLALDAAVRGQGVALTFRMLVEDELVSGRLTELDVSRLGPDVRLGAYVLRMRCDRAERRSVLAFQAWLLQALPPND